MMRLLLCLLFPALALCTPGSAQGQAREYQNLQVLPADISDDELTDTMLGFLTSLGLPRRAGEGCLHCHEGSVAVPRAQWDYASDQRPAKQTARRMLAMVESINRDFLGSLEQRSAPDLDVGCETCHRGRVDPRPIQMVLAEADEVGGIDSISAIYRRLHDRYFGSDAYDLRVQVLAGLAANRQARGDHTAALALSRLNEETHPDDPDARRVSLSLMILQELAESGAEGAVGRWQGLRASEPEGIVTYGILDNIGWQIYRQDRPAEALVLFRANREAFPDLYFTFESLVEARRGAGEITLDETIQAYETWLADHPGHEMAEAQLTNHRRRR